MGDNDTDTFDHGEDHFSYEDYAAEDYAGGTNSSYYDDDEYNYDDSSELTDIDYNPYDLSAQFTNTGTGAEAYDPIAKRQETKDDEEVGWRNPQTGAYEYYDDTDNIGSPDDWWADDNDKDYDLNDGEQQDFANNNSTDDLNTQSQNENFKYTKNNQEQVNSQKGNSDKYSGVINWKPGDEITLALLSQVWNECREIPQVRPLTELANKSVMGVLNSTGPNLVMRLNGYINKLVDSRSDTIGSLLDLASHQNKRLTFTALSVVVSIYTEQWPETVVLAALPTALQTAISTNPVREILNELFKVAVPLINLKYSKGKFKLGKK